MVRIPRIGVVLNGSDDDKEVLQSAVRLAAREGAQVRVVLGPGCSREMCEGHLDFAVWDVQQRLGLAAPRVTVEAAVPLVDPEVRDLTTQPILSPAKARA